VIASLTTALLLAGPAGTPASAGIPWGSSFEAALRKARASNKPLIVDFWAEWCTWCHRLDRTTYRDPVVVRLARGFVPVKVDTEGSAQEAAVTMRYDVTSLPTIAFLTPEGRLIQRVNGFQGPGQFPRTLEQAAEVGARLMAWEAALAQHPDDHAALSGLGAHLFEQEVYEESRDLLYAARRHDADAPTSERKLTRMLLGIIQHYDRKYGESEQLLKEALALRPPGDQDAKILFVLAKTYLKQKRTREARAALQKILTSHTQSPMAQMARDTLAYLEHR
jgi:thiol-disulfide isomerase/thioredoxin